MAAQNVAFHVVLDLSEDHAYSVLTLALEGYAERARADAATEGESEQPNQFQVDDFNALAELAETFLEDIERQLTEAGKSLT